MNNEILKKANDLSGFIESEENNLKRLKTFYNAISRENSLDCISSIRLINFYKGDYDANVDTKELVDFIDSQISNSKKKLEEYKNEFEKL